MGCSERWPDCLNKGSLEQTAIRDTGQAQLICILFDVTSCYRDKVSSVEERHYQHIHIHAVNKHILCRQAHAHLYIMDSLFIALSAAVSYF